MVVTIEACDENKRKCAKGENLTNWIEENIYSISVTQNHFAAKQFDNFTTDSIIYEEGFKLNDNDKTLFWPIAQYAEPIVR